MTEKDRKEKGKQRVRHRPDYLAGSKITKSELLYVPGVISPATPPLGANRQRSVQVGHVMFARLSHGLPICFLQI